MATPAAQITPGPPPQNPAPSAWTAAGVIAAVVGTLLILASYPVFVTGAGVMAVNHLGRDDGYVTSSTRTFHTDGQALVSDGVDLEMIHGAGSWMMRRVVGDVRVRVSSANGEPLFVGIAPTRDVMAYLRGASFTIIDAGATGVDRDSRAGHVAEPPMAQGIWAISTQGSGPQTLTWPPEQGYWSLVVMSPSGRPGLDVRMDVGAQAPGLRPFAWTSLAAGGVLLVLGAGLVVVAAHRAKGRRTATAGR